MTRFLAWADGSVARLDIDERGLGLALRDPDGQVAAVFVDDWKAMHSAYSGVRGYVRFVLTDGSMGDAHFARPNLAEDDPDEEKFTSDLGHGVTHTEIRKHGGAEHGGTTITIDDNGQGKVSTTTLEGDGTTSVKIAQQDENGNTHSDTNISHPDGTSTTISSDIDANGRGSTKTTEFNQGTQTSQTVERDFFQAGDLVHQSETKLQSGETIFHHETEHDGSKYTEEITTDPTGQVTSHETDYTWPGHETKSSLNPDGTTTVTNHSDTWNRGENHITDSTEVRDANGQPVGDTITWETITLSFDPTKTQIDTIKHADGSSEVVKVETDPSGQIQSRTEVVTTINTDGSSEVITTKFDENGQIKSQTVQSNPPPNVVEPPDGTTDRPDTTDRTEEPDPDEGPIDRTEEPDPDEGPIDPNEGGFKPKPGRGGIDLTGQPCDPTSGDPFCSAILLKARTNSRGAVGDEVDTLHSFFLLSQSRSGPDDPATTIVRLAQDLFGASETARERRGSPLVMEVQSGVRGADRSWDQLDQPILLVGSLTQISDRMKNRH